MQKAGLRALSRARPGSIKPRSGSRARLGPRPRSTTLQPKRLLDLDGRAGVFELLLDLRGFVVVDPILQRLCRAFLQELRVVEVEPVDRTNLLDRVALLPA